MNLLLNSCDNDGTFCLGGPRWYGLSSPALEDQEFAPAGYGLNSWGFTDPALHENIWKPRDVTDTRLIELPASNWWVHSLDWLLRSSDNSEFSLAYLLKAQCELDKSLQSLYQTVESALESREHNYFPTFEEVDWTINTAKRFVPEPIRSIKHSLLYLIEGIVHSSRLLRRISQTISYLKRCRFLSFASAIIFCGVTWSGRIWFLLHSGHPPKVAHVHADFPGCFSL